MSQLLVLVAEDWSDRASATGCSLTPSSYGTSCSWWVYKRTGPCPFCRVVPRQAPWTKAQPPDPCPQAPSKGLPSGWDPSNPIQGRVNCSLNVFFIRVLQTIKWKCRQISYICITMNIVGVVFQQEKTNVGLLDSFGNSSDGERQLFSYRCVDTLQGWVIKPNDQMTIL